MIYQLLQKRVESLAFAATEDGGACTRFELLPGPMLSYNRQQTPFKKLLCAAGRAYTSKRPSSGAVRPLRGWMHRQRRARPPWRAVQEDRLRTPPAQYGLAAESTEE